MDGTESTAVGKKSFWETLPGLLTAVATVLSALAGLLAVLHKSPPAPSTDASPIVETSRPAAPVHRTRRASAPADQARQDHRPIDVSGLWRDLNYGTVVRIRQTGIKLYSETFDSASGQRMAVGSGQISGRRIEGPYQWADGTRYVATLMVSEDGQEITGSSRNLFTGQLLPAHFVR